MEYTIAGKTPDQLEEKLAQYHKLTAQREALSKRLKKAEAEKSSVNPRIYEKVKTEYTSKLASLSERLSPLASELDDAKKEYQEELTRLEGEIRVLEDELAEAEFRFRVGEFDESKLSEIHSRLNPDLSEKTELQTRIKKQLEAIDSDLKGTSSGEVSPKAAPPEPEAPAENPTSVDDGSSSRVTLNSGDPLEALSDKTDEEPADQSTDTRNGGNEAPNDASAKEAGAGPAAKKASFENPQEWIDEFGEGKRPSPDASPPKQESIARDEVAKPEQNDDPLSALADPSGDPNDAKQHETVEPPEQREEVSVGFPNMVIITGPSSGKKIPLLPMTMSIGREHDNNIELKDPDVGRYHARILYDRGRFVLEDLESSNGTWLNGERISESELKNGDRIKIGETELAIDFD